MWRLAIWDGLFRAMRYRGSHINGKIQRTLVLGNLGLYIASEFVAHELNLNWRSY